MNYFGIRHLKSCLVSSSTCLTWGRGVLEAWYGLGEVRAWAHYNVYLDGYVIVEGRA